MDRARDAATLVTYDSHKLAEKLERATGERLAALDATAQRAAYVTVFGRDAARDRGDDHVTRAPDAMDKDRGIDEGAQRGHERGRDSRRGPGREGASERGRERRPRRETGRERDGKGSERVSRLLQAS